MPPLDTEQQFKFLIACIKHNNSGKIDFDKVAKELNIVSKGAAAKRYERLLKAHGITGNGGNGAKAGDGSTAATSDTSAPATPKTPSSARKATSGGRKTQPGTSASKKRKVAAQSEDADDENIKSEVKDEFKRDSDDDSDSAGILV